MKLLTAIKFAFIITLLILGLEFLMVKVVVAQTPEIALQTIDVTQEDTVSADLIISSLDGGLAGYNIKVTLPNILSVDGVDLVPLGIDKIFINGNEVHIIAVDINNVINPGDTNVILATFFLTAVNYGIDNVIIDVVQIDDDSGTHVLLDVQNGLVTIARLFPILPEETERTADLDNDGLAEDLNGNGRFDFQDIILLFIHKESQEVLDNFDLFDYNLNGVVDFNDVVLLFEHLLN